MTNNDELALKLKREIALANMNGVHPALSITPDELSSLLAERDADKKRIEMLEKYANERDEQNQDLLLNIGSLQQRIAELEESKANLAILYDANLCDMLPGPQYMDPPDGGSVTPLEQVSRMVADYRNRITELESCGRIEYTRRLERRVSELESRTVSVKLPLMLCGSPHFNGGVKSTVKVFEAELAKAGINLEVGE